MGFIRTDEQVALNDLLVTVRKTVDHYRDAAKLLDDKNFSAAFNNLADLRGAFIIRLDAALRAIGDLPSVPDPDKQAGEMLVHHVAALLKSDYAGDIVKQRIEAEKKLANLVVDARTAGLQKYNETLLDDIAEHVAQTIEKLQSIHKVVGEREA